MRHIVGLKTLRRGPPVGRTDRPAQVSSAFQAASVGVRRISAPRHCGVARSERHAAAEAKVRMRWWRFADDASDVLERAYVASRCDARSCDHVPLQLTFECCHRQHRHNNMSTAAAGVTAMAS